LTKSSHYKQPNPTHFGLLHNIRTIIFIQITSKHPNINHFNSLITKINATKSIQSKSIKRTDKYINKKFIFTTTHMKKEIENENGERENLFNRNGESDHSRNFRFLNNLFSDNSPAATHSSTRNNVLPRRPRVLRRLNSEKNFPEKLLWHVSPTTLP